MACSKCKADAIEGIREPLCGPCFNRWVERRVGKELREHNLITKGGTYVVENDLCAFVLKAIIKGMPITIFKDDDKVLDDASIPVDAIRVRCWTLDDEIASLFSDVLSGKEALHLGQANTGDIKLFLSLTDKELSIYANAKGLEFTPKPKGQIKTILDSLEEKHPETRFSVASSAKELARIMNEKSADTLQ